MRAKARRAAGRAAKSVVSLALLALAVVPLVVLVKRIASSPSPPMITPRAPGLTNPHFTRKPVPIRDSRGLEYETYECPPNNPADITVVLFLAKLNVTGRLLSASAAVCVGDDAGPQLDRQSAGPWRATLSIGTAEITQTLDAGLTDSLQRFGSTTIQLFGDPGTYPLDLYGAPLEYNLSLTGPRGMSPDFSDSLVAEADPAANDFAWSITNPETVTKSNGPGQLPSEVQVGYQLMGQRSVATRLFVVCLLVVPLVLIAHRLLANPRSTEGLVGVSAALLAILPIRIVLVPGDVSTLTLVDFALAFEMALLASWTAVVYLWAPQKPLPPK